MALSSRRCAQLVAFVLALTCIPAHATVNQSMQDWFNEIGAYGNVTGPNAYRGQTMNMYTGGSLYMRTPVRNYQLASISPPSFSAGCGGIDRSRRKLVIIDESWDLMGTGASGGFIEAGYRRARKYGGSFGTITQSVDDYYKNEATKAAINNADWLFLLRQKPENIERLGKEGKLSLDEWLKRQLGSVSTEHGHYSEIYIHSPMGSGLGRLILDPFSMLTYSTRAEDYEAIKRLREQGVSVADAIEQLVAQRESCI